MKSNSISVAIELYGIYYQKKKNLTPEMQITIETTSGRMLNIKLLTERLKYIIEISICVSFFAKKKAVELN